VRAYERRVLVQGDATAVGAANANPTDPSYSELRGLFGGWAQASSTAIPAVTQTPALPRTMPRCRPVEELAALVSPRLRAATAERGIELVSYADLRLA
jgi:hypothetical protein